MKEYKTLEKVFKKINDLEQAQAVLHWDMATMMPSGGAEARGEQLATLGSIVQAILTDEEIGDLIGKASENTKALNNWQKGNVAEMQRLWRHANAVDSKLNKELTVAGTKCEMIWRKARENNDFKAYAAELKKVVAITRDIAKAKASAFECDPYDALLDRFDPGRKSAQLDEVFKDLSAFLPDFIAKVTEKQKSEKRTPLKGDFPIEKQKELAEKVLDVVGFNRHLGRFDESIHPFCGGYPTDVRITTRYDEADFASSLMGVIHEAGHAQYESSLPSRWRNQPVGKARGMSVHESQSLLLEMQASRSKEFLSFLMPLAKETFGAKGREWTANNMHRLYTKVEPSLIRVDADEVTYPCHIMLRYYIEKYLISGDMEVSDLPDAWAQGMEKFLGIKPDTDANGCMQDIHWTDGSFGYFPCYTIGAIYASQLYKTANESIKDLGKSLKKGDFSELMAWLGKNIHGQGSLHSADDLIKKATGKPLDVQTFKDHLTTRYLES